MVYMNTDVTRGASEFVVTATAMATEVGHISGMLAEEQAVKTRSPARWTGYRSRSWSSGASWQCN